MKVFTKSQNDHSMKEFVHATLASAFVPFADTSAIFDMLYSKFSPPLVLATKFHNSTFRESGCPKKGKKLPSTWWKRPGNLRFVFCILKCLIIHCRGYTYYGKSLYAQIDLQILKLCLVYLDSAHIRRGIADKKMEKSSPSVISYHVTHKEPV